MRLYLGYIPLWIATIVIIFCDGNVIRIVMSIFTQSSGLGKDNTSSSQSFGRTGVTKTKVALNKVAFIRFACIPVVFVILHIPGSINRVTQALDITMSETTSVILSKSQAFCDPAHGIVNVVTWIFSDRDLLEAWYLFFMWYILSESEYQQKVTALYKLKLDIKIVNPTSTSSHSSSGSSVRWSLPSFRLSFFSTTDKTKDDNVTTFSTNDESTVEGRGILMSHVVSSVVEHTDDKYDDYSEEGGARLRSATQHTSTIFESNRDQKVDESHINPLAEMYS